MDVSGQFRVLVIFLKKESDIHWIWG